MQEENENGAFDHQSSSLIKLNNGTVLYLREVSKFLALVCILREDNFDKQGMLFTLIRNVSIKILFYYIMKLTLLNVKGYHYGISFSVIPRSILHNRLIYLLILLFYVFMYCMKLRFVGFQTFLCYKQRNSFLNFFW